MVKHQPLQVYERQLCLSCLTGIYGCRWKRYQRSHDDSSKWECMWFLILTSTFLLLLVWSYFWWAVQNDYSEFNWFLYNGSGEWSDGTIPILATTAAGFTYVAFLMMLALCHIAVGQQLNLYWLHKIGVMAAMLMTITGMISIHELWGGEWDIIVISLQATGPFLHIGALAAITALGWLMAGQVIRAEKTRFQVVLLLFYLSVLLALYLAPLTITSPCLMDRTSLKQRPDVIGHRGAPMLAPENTIMSFSKAVQQKVSGLEADVTISLDGVPFLMRDYTLRRTTDVEKVFPARQFNDASLFNWTELRSLNAGQWFLKDDPYWTVQSMSQRDQNRARNQTVCSLQELLRVAIRSNRSVIFNLRRPPPEHPRYNSWINDTLQAFHRSGIPQEQVMWTPDWGRVMVEQEAPGFRQISGVKLSVEVIRDRGLMGLHLHYSQTSAAEIRDLLVNNMNLSLYTVNEPWLYSLLWCSGVPAVSSDAPQILKKSPQEYCLVWITSDLVSFAIIIGVFAFQKWRLSGIRSYNPEQIMLSAAAVRSSHRDVSLMKEKLIFSEINNGTSSAEELSLYAENGYDGYTNEGIAH
ncbi:glycerophosphodiester phosphodiesterase domain-containing protein 5 isoform X2 [Conger conger]|uniref:glycerophosphodiester phosphodiesterase domain-containing protein 5 isoform X2 n=1 Tax=Conger conger TaxID=82655 RepID=UPI002A598413|nr:glycerophosphodiester phosphodiesterase domain-containing protein 5 isoform X2 [Conger conger]